MTYGTDQVEHTAPAGAVALADSRGSVAIARAWTIDTAVSATVTSFPMTKDGNGHPTTPRPEEAIP